MDYYSAIKSCDIANGLGCRVVIFLSGCNHHCKNCHNPETWNPYNGDKFTEDTMKYILDLMNHDYIDGITISGGDPLYNGNVFTTEYIIQKVKERYPNKNIWLYTGYLFEDVLAGNIGSMINYNDLSNIIHNIDVLIDGEYREDLHDITYPWAGSTNQRVIDVKKSLETDSIVLFDYKNANK